MADNLRAKYHTEYFVSQAGRGGYGMISYREVSHEFRTHAHNTLSTLFSKSNVSYQPQSHSK